MRPLSGLIRRTRLYGDSAIQPSLSGGPRLNRPLSMLNGRTTLIIRRLDSAIRNFDYPSNIPKESNSNKQKNTKPKSDVPKTTTYFFSANHSATATASGPTMILPRIMPLPSSMIDSISS